MASIQIWISVRPARLQFVLKHITSLFLSRILISRVMRILGKFWKHFRHKIEFLVIALWVKKIEHSLHPQYGSSHITFVLALLKIHVTKKLHINLAKSFSLSLLLLCCCCCCHSDSCKNYECGSLARLGTEDQPSWSLLFLEPSFLELDRGKA